MKKLLTFNNTVKESDLSAHVVKEVMFEKVLSTPNTNPEKRIKKLDVLNLNSKIGDSNDNQSNENLIGVKTTMKSITSFSGKYYFLSNFYPCPVTVLGMEYQSSEAAFMACKTLDIQERAKFQNLKAKEAKALGQKIKLRADWEIVSLEMMELCLRSKFMANPEIRQQLIDTGNAYLEEENTWGDTKWGTYKGQGKNLLGKLLMYIREDLQK